MRRKKLFVVNLVQILKLYRDSPKHQIHCMTHQTVITRETRSLPGRDSLERKTSVNIQNAHPMNFNSIHVSLGHGIKKFARAVACALSSRIAETKLR